MLLAAVWILTLTVVAGTILALWHLRATDNAKLPPLAAGIAHGVAGAIGLVLLLLALGGPPRGVEAGAGSFGIMSAALLACALLAGIVLLKLQSKSVTMTIHAGLAITGYVLLLAWDASG